MGICLVFFLTLLHWANTQTPSPQCDGVNDYNPCKTALPDDSKCGENSMCYCKDKNPYCRCNSYLNEWFIGENCEIKWTTVNFALVASLPGIALTLIVGVACCFFKSSDKKARLPKVMRKKEKAAAVYQNDDMKDMVFASDLQERPNSRIPLDNMRQPGNRLPMEPMQGSNYSGMPPPPDRAAPGRPFNQPNREYVSVLPSQDRPPVGGFSPNPNSYGSGMGQVLRNPYSQMSPGRPQYEERSPSSDYGLRPKQPPVNGMRVMATDFPHSSPADRPYPQQGYSAPNPQFQRSMREARY